MAKNISCYLIRISHVLTCVHCFLSFCCTWLGRVWFYLLYNLWSGSCSEQECVSFPFSIPSWTVPASRAFSCTSCTPTPDHLGGLHWTHSSLSIPFCTERPKIDTTPNAVLQVPKNSTGPASYTSTKPACSWPSLLQGHTAGSCLTCCSQGHQDLSLQNCFSDSQPWPVLFHWVIPSKKQDWVFSCWTSQGSCMSFLQVPLKSSLSLQLIVHLTSLVLFTNLMTEGTVSASWSWVKIRNSLCASFAQMLGCCWLPDISRSYSLQDPLTQSMSHPFAGQDSVRDYVKGSIKSKHTTLSALCITLVSSLWKMMTRINLE